MARRRENIYERRISSGDSRYDVMLSYKDPMTGERKQKMRTFTTLAAAKAALAENQHNRALGHAAPPTGLTLGVFLQEWLAHQEAHVRPSTIAVYQQIIAQHIMPYLGNVPLAELTSRQLEAHYAALRAQGVGPYAVKNTHYRLVQALRYARRHRLIRANPAEEIDTPKTGRHEFAAWDDADIERFLERAQLSRYGPIWSVAIQTGMRRGELLGLRWQDIDETERVIHVRQQLANVRGVFKVHAPKSGKARRIAVGSKLLTELRAHRAVQLQWRLVAGTAWQELGLVFTTHHGTPIGLHGLFTDFRAIVDVAGVPLIRIHDLRHTHASWLFRHGRTLSQVSQRLGHSRTSITVDVYAHVLPDEHREIADLIDRQMAL